MGTVKGVPVTEEQIEQWAAEAEAGYDVEVLRKRGRKTIGDGPGRVVPFRLEDSLIAALEARAAEEHINRSEALRRAIRSYVS